MKHITLSFLVIFLMIYQGYSQQEQPIYRHITTLDYMKSIEVKDKKSIEKEIKYFTKFSEDSVRILPIVFHIIYTEGMPSVHESQIMSQLDALNRDFNSLVLQENHPNDKEGKYKNRAAITEIRFCFPLNTPNNILSDGYTILNSSLTGWEQVNDMKSKNMGVEP